MHMSGVYAKEMAWGALVGLAWSLGFASAVAFLLPIGVTWPRWNWTAIEAVATSVAVMVALWTAHRSRRDALLLWDTQRQGESQFARLAVNEYASSLSMDLGALLFVLSDISDVRVLQRSAEVLRSILQIRRRISRLDSRLHALSAQQFEMFSFFESVVDTIERAVEDVRLKAETKRTPLSASDNWHPVAKKRLRGLDENLQSVRKYFSE